MNMLAAIPGILLPAIVGWLAVRLAEGGRPVLTMIERTGWSLIVGPTVSMLGVFLLASAGIVGFTLWGFLIPLVLLIALLGAVMWRTKIPVTGTVQRAECPEPLGWRRIGILIFTVWTVLKLLAGAYDLISVPTYWDDSFNNWNMRGKMFYETKQLTLEIPVGNGVVQTAQGVSSYPPSLPLMKTWVSTIRGSWQEPLVNGIQLVWLAGLLCVFFGTLRRTFGVFHALFGTSLLVSLPLVMIQSMNPYAEIFVAAHLLIAITALWRVAEVQNSEESAAWMRLLGLASGVLLFTKNEALLIYLPLLLIIGLWVIIPKLRMAETRARTISAIITAGIILMVLGAPWIIYKWMQGLTFGNAKAVSGVAITFSTKAFWTVWHNLSHEPNMLLLPLLLPMALIAAGRNAFRRQLGILSIFVIGAIGIQFALFIFVGALETEAVMQTGLGRGLVQIAPVAMLLIMFCVRELLDETTEA